MNEKLKGKTVLITGASSGLGEKIARLSAKSGARLLLVARNEEKLANLCQELQSTYSVSCEIFPMDIGNFVEIETTFRTRLQNESIDVLVNNAGVGLFKDVLTTDVSEAKKMFDVNVLGLIGLTKEVLPSMIKRRSGHIINIASQAGKIATPKSAVYSATKKAVIGFSDSLRMEVKDFGIFVTTVNPGPIATNFFATADESGQYLQSISSWVLDPEDVAKQIVSKMFSDVREINMPFLMNTASKIYALFPGLVERIGKPFFYKK
ncbi:SDR family NAD(P)-dependent oxidoreductase [Fervidibacillus halotolerans]|uniref:SDR family oxidoreductase n=1 Tax=Fervidibacillus halotolerans TaxID=2980027 RepID=A0A9E8M2E5_9BACI|nr:SDR family oxidoreductase [Fervidibacillus halotolerans]WAA13837.1 SDR family oxidoreductase [Fervidibacillus halotolerans]